MISRDGIYVKGVDRRTASNWVHGALAALMRRRNVSTAARLSVHNAELVPTDERKMNAVEMRYLCKICGVSLADRIHNEEIHEKERAQLVWARRTN